MEELGIRENVGYLAQLDDQLFLEFFSDTMFWMKGESVPFLKKYSENIPPERIPAVRRALRTLMSVALCKRITSQAEFLEYMAEVVGGEEAIGGKKRFYVFLTRLETLKQIFIEESVRTQEKYLVDFNVNVEYVIGSSSFDSLEEYI
mmetsp:Transcript_14907/g.17246  ORF Transcript_14907/g.17246 Transcript_14907/m.17246 type:complete len:147 (+) Transcript_14907:12-452(+)